VTPLITLTSDFGTADGYAAAMKGVLSSDAPGATLIDLSHDVARHDVSAAAWLLLRSAPFFPPETIHLAVVDPGVGTARWGLVLEIGGQFFVGPDNGIFSLVPHRLAGPWRGVALDRTRFRLGASTSAVFEGRDVFAPAAAALANTLLERTAGTRMSPIDLSEFGDPVANWIRLPWTEPHQDGADWVGEVIRIDRFGNAVTSLSPVHGDGPIEVKGHRIERSRTYGEVPPGTPVALESSSGFLEIAVNLESAAERLDLRRGDTVRLLAGPPVRRQSPPRRGRDAENPADRSSRDDPARGAPTARPRRG
jgi:S-adenosyl-L-methionine hydrolase (adenosine-forming)